MNIEYLGKVVEKREPKPYTNKFGTYIKFYVEFSDGQKAMFHESHINKFQVGDIICISGIARGEWLSVIQSKDVKKINSENPKMGFRKLPDPYELSSSGHYRRKSEWKGKAPYSPTKDDGALCGNCKECGGNIIKDAKKRERVCEKCGLVS